jgi:glutaredoxin
VACARFSPSGCPWPCFDDAGVMRHRRRGRVIALFVATALLLSGGLAVATAVAGEPEEAAPTITYFGGDGCPYCAAEEEFLADLVERYPQVTVDAYEVWYDAAGRARYLEVAAQHGIEPRAVPATFVAGRSWIGFSPEIGHEIEAVVVQELERLAPEPTAAPAPSPPAEPTTEPVAAGIELPIVGRVELAGQSLFATTGLIAFVDGFNPCSLWVLSVLLAMMLHSGSRRRILAVGLTFLMVTAAAYGLFIVGLFSVIGFVGYLWWVQVLMALIVLTFAVLAIKDYFWFGRGVSLSIPERRKPKIYRDSRSLVQSERPLLAILAGTVILAGGVALVELPCTAGFPVLWSGILAERGVAGAEFGVLLSLYLGIYLFDELLLFGTVLVTLRVTRLQERHGRILKLVAGTVMLALAGTMLLAPATLNSVTGAVAVFAASLGAAFAVLIAHRQVLPRLGIRIGNEASL